MSGWQSGKVPSDGDIANGLGITIEELNKRRARYQRAQSPNEIIKKIRDKRNSPEAKAMDSWIEEAGHKQYVGIIEELLKQGKITKDDLRKLIEEAA